MEKTEILSRLDALPSTIVLDGKKLTPISEIVNLFGLSYTGFYDFFLKYNTKNKIAYMKIGIIKLLEINDYMLELLQLYVERTYNSERFDELKKN